MGRGRGSFARVAARATCRELNKKRQYGSTATNNAEEISSLAIILALLFIVAIVGFFIWVWSTTGIFGTMAVIFIILFFKALLG